MVMAKAFLPWQQVDAGSGRGEFIAVQKKNGIDAALNEPSREDDVLNGIMILVVGFCFYAAIWGAVIYGASFFGPK